MNWGYEEQELRKFGVELDILVRKYVGKELEIVVMILVLKNQVLELEHRREIFDSTVVGMGC